MPRIELEYTDEPLVGQGGLVAVGELCRIAGVNEATLHRENPNAIIRDYEIIRTLCGLLSQGKSDYEFVRQFKEDEFFGLALGIKNIPSPESLRQRLEKMSEDERLPGELSSCSNRLWKKLKMKPQVVKRGGNAWVRLDGDISLWNNHGSKKQGVEKTYEGFDGYAPIFFHLGGGWLVSAKLRPGNHHSLHEGTLGLVREAVTRAAKMAGYRILTVLDCGFESAGTIKMFYGLEKKTDFILKHNLRGESKEDWLKTAKKYGKETNPRPGKKVWTGSVFREVKGREGPVRLVFEVVERTIKKGRCLLLPEIKIFSVWTNVDLPEKDVLELYRKRGESEQYHAEFKSEMDMERLPSGKLATNNLFFQIGVLTYNMMRMLASDLAGFRAAGLKKATRRRIRTVIRNMIYCCGKLIKHARRLILKIGGHQDWYTALFFIFNRLRAA